MYFQQHLMKFSQFPFNSGLQLMETKFLVWQVLSWWAAHGFRAAPSGLMHGCCSAMENRQQGERTGQLTKIKKSQSGRLCFVSIIPRALVELYGSGYFPSSPPRHRQRQSPTLKSAGALLNWVAVWAQQGIAQLVPSSACDDVLSSLKSCQKEERSTEVLAAGQGSQFTTHHPPCSQPLEELRTLCQACPSLKGSLSSLQKATTWGGCSSKSTAWGPEPAHHHTDFLSASISSGTKVRAVSPLSSEMWLLPMASGEELFLPSSRTEVGDSVYAPQPGKPYSRFHGELFSLEFLGFVRCSAWPTAEPAVCPLFAWAAERFYVLTECPVLKGLFTSLFGKAFALVFSSEAVWWCKHCHCYWNLGKLESPYHTHR